MFYFFVLRCYEQSERDGVAPQTQFWVSSHLEQESLQTRLSRDGDRDRLQHSQQEGEAARLLQEDRRLQSLHQGDPEDQERAAHAPHPQHDPEVLSKTVGRGRQEVEDGGSRCWARDHQESAGPGTSSVQRQ